MSSYYQHSTAAHAWRVPVIVIAPMCPRLMVLTSSSSAQAGYETLTRLTPAAVCASKRHRHRPRLGKLGRQREKLGPNYRLD